MKIHFPTYENSILDVMNAIRKYEGLETFRKIDEDTYNWLVENKIRQVQVCLIDGMGADIVDRHGDDQGFIKRHRIRNVETVYPPTTVAATTAIQIGKTPIETGWLGWQMYFPQKGTHIIPFLNVEYYTGNVVDIPDYVYKVIPVKPIQFELQENGICATEIYPAFRYSGAKNFDQTVDMMVNLSKDEKCKYAYVYWDKFDSTCHAIGVDHPDTVDYLHHIDEQLARLESELAEDVAVFVIADHSLIDTRIVFLNDYPDLVDTFDVLPSIEGRTVSFLIKEGRKQEFVSLFNQYFKDEFVLYTKEEALKKNLFGEYHEGARGIRYLGDYIACAISDVCLYYDEHRKVKMIGNHAGMTEAEIMIPLIRYKRGC